MVPYALVTKTFILLSNIKISRNIKKVTTPVWFQTVGNKSSFHIYPLFELKGIPGRWCWLTKFNQRCRLSWSTFQMQGLHRGESTHSNRSHPVKRRFENEEFDIFRYWKTWRSWHAWRSTFRPCLSVKLISLDCVINYACCERKKLEWYRNSEWNERPSGLLKTWSLTMNMWNRLKWRSTIWWDMIWEIYLRNILIACLVVRYDRRERVKPAPPWRIDAHPFSLDGPYSCAYF